MYGTPKNNIRDVFIDSEDDTLLDDRKLVITDFIELLKGIDVIYDISRTLTNGVELSLGDIPLKTFNTVINEHVSIINKLGKAIKNFKNNNRLIISKLKEEKKNKEEKKIKEETKPQRRKTELL